MRHRQANCCIGFFIIIIFCFFLRDCLGLKRKSVSVKKSYPPKKTSTLQKKGPSSQMSYPSKIESLSSLPQRYVSHQKKLLLPENRGTVTPKGTSLKKEIPLLLLQKKIHPPSPNKKGVTPPPPKKHYPFSSLPLLSSKKSDLTSVTSLWKKNNSNHNDYKKVS